MAKHAPAPWKQHPVDETFIIDGNGDEVARVSGDYDDPKVWPVMVERARLIAAAPDLYASLEDAIRPFAGDVSPPRWVSVARAALSRATGDA